MKSVHFIADRSRIVDYLVTPVRLNRRRLRARGYDVRIHSTLSDRALSCDILGLASKTVLNLVGEPHAVIRDDSPTRRVLERARSSAGKVVWFDTSDSTGVTHFELMPYVDLYLKKQLLADLSGYEGPMYGGRPFSDFYHREFGIEDSEPFQQHYPLEESYREKVDLSWNMGLGELYHSFSLRGKIRRFLPGVIPARLDAPSTPPEKERPLDVFMRASANWSRESVVFHRKELIRRIEELIREHDLSGSVSREPDETYLSLAEYRSRLQHSKVTFGPFGWGELNLREYEAFMFGALLLRPDLSHMRTWPDLFRDEETCVFYRWDFEDLEEKLLLYLNDAQARERVARQGQELYQKQISEEGMEAFCDWFVQQIER